MVSVVFTGLFTWFTDFFEFILEHLGIYGKEGVTSAMCTCYEIMINLNPGILSSVFGFSQHFNSGAAIKIHRATARVPYATIRRFILLFTYFLS